MDSINSRPLGPWRSWALVVGGTIGSAVFMMPALVAPYGGVGLLSLAAGGVGALFVAVTLGNLSRRVTFSGGPYAYARAGLGDFAGFLIAWAYWISQWTACAGMAIAFSAYLGKVLPMVAAFPILGIAAGIAMTWSVVATNVAGVRESGIVGLITTLLKLLPLLAIGTIGLLCVDAKNLPPWNPGSGDSLYLFASAFGLTFWNYIGIESATVPAEDVLDSQKTISRSLVLGTLTITVLYLLVTFATMGIIPASVLATSDSPLADVGKRIAGNWGGTLVTVGALVSIVGALNIAVLCAGQMGMAAARDQVFPAFFKRMTARNTPGVSYFIVGVLITAMILMNYTRGLVGAYRFIILIATLTSVIPYAFAAVAALLLDVRDRKITRRRRIREAATAAVAFAVCFWVIATSGQESVYWVFLLLIGGMPVYIVVTRDKHLNDNTPAEVDGKQGAGLTGNTHVATATNEYVHGTN
jgi:APA family basic amino acid/polyamine antiporter